MPDRSFSSQNADTAADKLAALEAENALLKKELIRAQQERHQFHHTQLKYSSLVDNAAIAFIHFDAQGLIIDFNQHALQLFGYQRAQMLAMKWPELFAEAHDIIERIHNLQSTGGSYRGVAKGKNKAGSSFPINITAAGYVEAISNEHRCSLLIEDITDNEQRELLLEQTTALALMGGWELNLVTNQLHWSKMLFTIHEVGATFEPSTESALAFYPEGYNRDEMVRLLQLAIQEGKPFETTLQVVTGKSNLRWIRSKGNVEIVNGKPIRVYGTCQDITKEKLLEDDLVRVQSLFKAAFENSAVGMAIVGLDGFCIEINDRLCQILGYNREELNHLSYLDLSHPDDRHVDENWFERFRNGQAEACQFEKRYLKKNGEVIWALLGIALVKNNEGKSPYFVSQIVDITEQKRSDDQVRDERNLLRTLIDNFPDSIYVKDNQARKLITNQVDLNLMGVLNADAVLGKTDLEIFTTETGKAAYEDDLRILQSGEAIINKEEDFYDRNGNHVWLLTSKVPIRNDQAEIVGLLGIGRDITRFKEYEDLLKASNERFEFVTKATFDAVWDWDLLGNEVYRSDAFYQLFGYDFETGRVGWHDWYELVHPADREHVQANFDRFIKSDSINWQDSYRFKKQNGHYAYVQNKCIKIKNESGKTIRLIGAIQDISAQKQEEQRLRLMESAVDKTNDMVIITENFDNKNINGPLIVYVNDAFTRITGYGKNEAIGNTPAMLQGPASDRVALRQLSESLRRNQAGSIETINYKKDGTEFWVHLSVAPIFDETGKCTHWISINRDITPRKKAEKEREVLYEIIETINNYNINQAMSLVIKKLCTELEFPYGEIWLLNYEKNRMVYKAHWQENKKVGAMFDENNIGNTIMGFSLKGTAWKNKKALYWENLANEDFSRKAAALQAGITSGMALPVMYNGEVIAIFSFFDVKPFRQDQIQNELLKRIGTQLGASIEKTRAEDELYNFFHLSADMLCVAGMDGFFKKINPAFSVVLGYTEEELLEKPFFQFLHPEDLEETRLKIHQLIKGEPLWFFENRFITKSGEIKWLEWTGTPIVEENIMFAIAKDITQKKKFESERKQILDSISDNFYALDKNYNFTYLNAAAEKLLGGQGGILIGKNIWETFPVLKGEEFYANAQLSVSSRKPIHFEYYSNIVNCWFEENFYPTEDGLSVFFKSINERKHAEARMKEMNLELEKKAAELSSINAELERFAYVASHDLQEPLRMVNGFLQLLHKKHADQLNEDAKSYIDFAIDGSNRMKNLISDLLQYSRAGGMNMELEDVSMNKVLEDVQLLLKAAIQEKNAKIDIGNLPDIVANKTAITQLLQNLIGNALKYQPEKQIPYIQIRADRTHAGWLFSVADNGLGIIESQREKVFEVFQRLHAKQKFTGTGIGLSICKKIVERLGGKIWVEANQPQGCLFKFIIPFVQLPN